MCCSARRCDWRGNCSGNRGVTATNHPRRSVNGYTHPTLDVRSIRGNLVMIAVRQLERPYTADDLATMPDDGRRFEVIGGELAVSPSPSTEHQRVLRKLIVKIDEYLTHLDSGEVFTAPLDVVLGNHDILQPDVFVVLHENASRVTDSGVDGPPDLVIEITSPSTAPMDRIRKSATYATFGVPEYWIVDPHSKSILAQRLVDGQYQPIDSVDGMVRSRRISGLAIDPAEIFSPSRLLADQGDQSSR